MRVTDFLSPEELSKLKHLQVLARQVVEGAASGLHRSPHKGFSVQFKEHRQYVRGDEIRSIDWKIYGKTDRYYIREYEEETNLRCTMLVDCSGSMRYAGSRAAGLSKHQYATRLAASLAYLLLGQQDSVGLVTFDAAVRQIIPPRSRPSHLRAILATLARTEPQRETELGKVFHQLAAKLHRRGLLVVISDCFGDVDELLKAFAHFRHAHHEIIVFQVLDPDEVDFPFQRRTQFRCLEAAGNRQTVDPAQLRQVYIQRLQAFREQLQAGCRRNHIDLVPVTTDMRYADVLAEYLRLRRRSG
ncbi:DUF58 domain-containing protein [Roseimaritima sediminicola]|uniref:DUF58 domain-containing protein n=1 Tax=Roseimaritima sediminicola TaxID=2662066 RepID=UPI00129848BC|nr:DUF58 domain-containing protein [Roseimaritima sediminicola]